ncbi:hypothetical protein OESDEN_12812 [Oesophagostomum dentatum]|uniref:G-protein coupled receptors family 1 profile domain-containing protein n=1 Tax=Oesophagostomum dentatum TaxID=61180 RepID=A0A0B1SU39_OESDE|nr:hypothetical protein OESDEN_12812 [Oesophagostomum dentatum]
MVSPTNVVLKYMAIAELLVGIVPLPWTIFFYTMGNYNKVQNLELWWCYLNKFSMDAFPPVFHNIAMWLTVLLAGQRYVSISYPLHSREISNVRNVRRATLLIAVVSLMCGLPKSFDYFYETIEGWVFTRGRWKYTRERSTEEAARQRDSNSTTLMLVAIVSLFLVVNVPQAAFMGVLCVCETFSIHFSLLEGKFPAVFLLVSNMLVMDIHEELRKEPNTNEWSHRRPQEYTELLKQCAEANLSRCTE